VRAALWLGSYYYTVGDAEQALTHFEQARSHASDPGLRDQAVFWCEQARLTAGVEPLPPGEAAGRVGFYPVLRRIARVDRSILQGRRSDAETELTALEEEARRSGCAGIALARWGRLARLAGSARKAPGDLLPLAREAASLPERAFFDFALVEESGAQPSAARWTLQFGAFLERGNAELQEQELSLQGIVVRIDEASEKGKTWYRDHSGDFAGRAEADSAARAIRAELDLPLQIVPAP
jgi:hypothetical protein